MNITDFLTKPAEAVEGHDGILYGDAKVGKTSTLDDPKFKVLLIDLEGGSAVLSEAENVTRIDIPDMAKRMNITQFEALQQVWAAVENGKLTGYDLYATDSITQFETITKEYVAKKFAPNRRREVQGKFGAQSDWGDLAYLITGMVKEIHGLTKRGERSIHHLWIAHVKEERNETTKQLEKTKVQLQGSTTADVVMSIVDGVYYMYNKNIVEEIEGKKTSRIERGILTRSAGGFVAAARQLKKKEPLPAKIVDPVWSEIFEKLGYVKK